MRWQTPFARTRSRARIGAQFDAQLAQASETRLRRGQCRFGVRMLAGMLGVGLASLCIAPAMAQPDILPRISAYLAEGPIENLLLQPEALPDDPSDEFFLVFDVRTADEVASGEMLPSARHVPYTDIAPILEALAGDRHQPTLIYCQTMLRSTQVVMALRLLGYDNVWYLAGGIERWRAAGKPLD